MLRTLTGDLLRQDADALVNAVNTTGVMGKGIALQFKQTWPDMFRDYRAACQRGEVQPGHMHVWNTGSPRPPRFIINFPTKRHWRSSSKLTDIEAGLADLARVIDELKLESIATPPLGCGHGGLAWADVEPLIHHKLALVAHRVDIRVFAPDAGPIRQNPA